MKIVMINDCAFVGETLLKYMPLNIEKQHITRTRGILDKTFRLACKILRAKGDVYHVHYLLQDCYFASRMGKKPLIGHAHGTDLRTSLNNPLWHRIIKHNLKTCDKILVSTPDVLDKARQFKDDAEYLPNPIDEEYFYTKPITSHDVKKRVLIASDSNWRVKGTDIVIRALSRIKDEVDVSIISHGADFKKTIALASSLGLPLNVLPKVPHVKFNEYCWSADIVVDRLNLGSLGMVSLEAVACGRPVIAYVSSRFHEYDDFPLKDVDTAEKVVNAVREADSELWKKEHNYLMSKHNLNTIVGRLLKLYHTLGEHR